MGVPGIELESVSTLQAVLQLQRSFAFFIPGGTQGLILTLCSEPTSGRLRGPYGIPGIKPRFVPSWQLAKQTPYHDAITPASILSICENSFENIDFLSC